MQKIVVKPKIFSVDRKKSSLIFVKLFSFFKTINHFPNFNFFFFFHALSRNSFSVALKTAINCYQRSHKPPPAIKVQRNRWPARKFIECAIGVRWKSPLSAITDHCQLSLIFHTNHMTKQTNLRFNFYYFFLGNCQIRL
jgi:hypothetical protein